ncbi:GNAT family N-acetyltransferase [Photobacterium atrarenae]|uniref:GNAT family N-acetyltransferase n=1 Tax=Photobacterium atrarenae TaxID=865757 RepID=A0ABY5GDK2_9GAMM|nr:GNAT family N-acetyltransferase [Photobacterium atrarenae]UTV26443.1 GNAT family N-acetyltransferase [Photobacterium atrarenae]
MKVSLVPIAENERPTLERLFQFYLYEMAACLALPLNAQGSYAYRPTLLDGYWTQPEHQPFFMVVENDAAGVEAVEQELAGFALIRRYPQDPARYDIDQFFVARKFKGQGVGKQALANLLNQFPGKWQIRVLVENEPALAFWQSAVRQVVGQHYEHSMDLDVDLMMHFFRFEV